MYVLSVERKKGVNGLYGARRESASVGCGTGVRVRPGKKNRNIFSLFCLFRERREIETVFLLLSSSFLLFPFPHIPILGLFGSIDLTYNTNFLFKNYLFHTLATTALHSTALATVSLNYSIPKIKSTAQKL